MGSVMRVNIAAPVAPEMVFERHDGSSCIVASGIGYQDGTDPSVIFRTAGLPG